VLIGRVEQAYHDRVLHGGVPSPAIYVVPVRCDGHSHDLIAETKEFVINVPTAEHTPREPPNAPAVGQVQIRIPASPLTASGISRDQRVNSGMPLGTCPSSGRERREARVKKIRWERGL
jgi:hypothetical protein